MNYFRFITFGRNLHLNLIWSGLCIFIVSVIRQIRLIAEKTATIFAERVRQLGDNCAGSAVRPLLAGGRDIRRRGRDRPYLYDAVCVYKHKFKFAPRVMSSSGLLIKFQEVSHLILLFPVMVHSIFNIAFKLPRITYWTLQLFCSTTISPGLLNNAASRPAAAAQPIPTELIHLSCFFNNPQFIPRPDVICLERCKSFV